jgi:GDP-L-fucose synthase
VAPAATFSGLKMTTLSGKRVVVTGGAGFLGQRVDAEFRACGAEVVVARKTDYDLVQREACRRLLADARPDIVVHLAARVGGLARTGSTPASSSSTT